MPEKKRELMAHQELALGMMANTGSLGVFYDMGTGKTAIALMYIYERLQHQAGLKVLVVCPKNLVTSWQGAMDELLLFDGVTKSGVAALKSAVTLVTYQKMYKTDYETIKRNGRQYTRKIHPLRPEVDKHWDILCIDESQHVGAHDSVQSRAAWELAKRSTERFLFTGTPVHGGGGRPDYSKLYGQIRVLDPFKWITWTQFVQRYVTRINPRFHKIERYNEPECKRLLDKYAIACRLEDCVDLPGITDIVVDCPLTEGKVYKDFENFDVEKYGVDIPTGGAIWTKLMQICSGSIKRAEDTLQLKTSKDDKLEEILEGLESPLVIFCNFRASIDRVYNICKKHGRHPVIIDGRTKDKAEWEKFQYGSADTIICQYLSGGAGLNLYKAHYMIMYEPHPSAEAYSQARRRIYRTGQKEKCIYYIFNTPKTVEAMGWNTVRNGLSYTEEMIREWVEEGF